jgi:hypothetical protein
MAVGVMTHAPAGINPRQDIIVPDSFGVAGGHFGRTAAQASPTHRAPPSKNAIEFERDDGSTEKHDSYDKGCRTIIGPAAIDASDERNAARADEPVRNCQCACKGHFDVFGA